ncbi:transporter substrate-binding domain-containing protein [Mycobacterium aquaticum]|uniref:Solute-binding protein family 3/N-terminal domain-containing protein n=1 Tax=Mycobacterium aquaticum TaxID=1927124 RepID=A0A1X0B4C4_9MYCO|nr:transporter substrate-binding domain-containing protein [Mycobacterium aquaticum]ORA37177.1 hypothetical protein BST13_08445 [Mycobacterium aquaticum]
MTPSTRCARIAWTTAASALAVGLIGGLTACGTDAKSSTPDEFKAKIVYVESRPDSYEENGKWTGISADAVHAILKSMGAAVDSESASDIAGVIPGVVANRYNLVGSSFYMTPERCKQVAFSDPLMLVTSAMAYSPNVIVKLTNIDSLVANPNLQLGLVQGSFELNLVTAGGVPVSRIAQYPDVTSAVEALKGGRVDVVMVDSITLTHIFKTTAGMQDLKLTDPFVPVVKGKPATVENALMFPKGETKVVEAFNVALAKLRDSGELTKIVAPYGVTEAQIVDAGKKTAAQVCAES